MFKPSAACAGCFAVPRFARLLLPLVVAVAAGPGFSQHNPPQQVAQIQLEGELEVHVEDYEHTSRTRHFLKTLHGRFELKFKGRAPDFATGARLRVTGSQLGNTVDLEDGAELVSPAALASTVGDQRTAVLLVNFQDNATQPYSHSQAFAIVFGSTSEFLRETSFQQTYLSGNVYGWYTLPINQTCLGTDIANRAKSAAQSAGVDLSGYSRFIYVFPRNSTCGWSASGTVGGLPSDAWINGWLEVKIVGHELGHNFGLQHSNAQECGASTLGETCTTQLYGDWMDIMGNANAGHYNAFQKERLGWFGASGSSGITGVESNGTFTLSPYETNTSGVKALKVLKSVDPATAVKSWYYVEYRQPIGFDSFVSTVGSNVPSGVILHIGIDGDARSSNLLDMTPASDQFYDFYDAALVAGKSYTDAAAGVTISVNSVNGTAASVGVSFVAQACVRANPALTLSPAQGPEVAAGHAVGYTLALTNKDSSACSPAGFNLTSAVPAGWGASFNSNFLYLAPGASASAILTVTSVSTSAAGVYGISATAATTSPSYGVTASGTFSVSAPVSNQAPIAVADSATTVTNTAVKIAVLANDSDPEGKPLRATAIKQGANGTAVINADNTVTYTPKRRFTGADSFSYTVSDGALTATATVSVQVNAKGGGKGG